MSSHFLSSIPRSSDLVYFHGIPSSTCSPSPHRRRAPESNLTRRKHARVGNVFPSLSSASPATHYPFKRRSSACEFLRHGQWRMMVDRTSIIDLDTCVQRSIITIPSLPTSWSQSTSLAKLAANLSASMLAKTTFDHQTKTLRHESSSRPFLVLVVTTLETYGD